MTTAGCEKPTAKLYTAFFTPEQQPEGPLGIENAVSGAKEGFSKEQSGQGRLYRPQATLARPPVTGQLLGLLPLAERLKYLLSAECV